MAARLVLLFGSDDLETRSLLDRIKLVVATTFQAEDTYCLIADQVEAYTDSSYDIILERYADHDATIFVFDKKGNLALLDDISIANYFDASEEVYDYLVNWSTKTGADIPNVPFEIRPIDKIQSLVKAASEVIVVRHRETTVGEEIISFALGASRHGEKFRLMAQEKVTLHKLLLDLVERYKIPVTRYADSKDLFSKAIFMLR